MKCHVVPGLNVALHYVIAVRNGIILRNDYNKSFCTYISNIFFYTYKKCFEINCYKILIADTCM